MKTEKKIPLSKALSLHYRAFQVLQKNCPGLLPSIFFHSAVGAVLPYVGIYFSAQLLNELAANGQIATQYVDLAGEPSMDLRYDPNGSVLAVEGITSADGRVLGKMGHSERSGPGLYANVPGDKYQPLFEGGVEYFS